MKHRFFKDFSKTEHALFKKLNSPTKIQDYLDSLGLETDCLKGALLGAAALLYHGHQATILDLQPRFESADDGHAVALFKIDGYWGAISKTNHAVLRYRDAIYKSPRELVMSYFHEYFLDDGVKNLRSYTVLHLNTIKKNWVTDERNVQYVDDALNQSVYKHILTKKQEKVLRPASKVEIEAGKIVIFPSRKTA